LFSIFFGKGGGYARALVASHISVFLPDFTVSCGEDLASLR
jgi:hypothetical protein